MNRPQKGNSGVSFNDTLLIIYSFKFLAQDHLIYVYKYSAQHVLDNPRLFIKIKYSGCAPMCRKCRSIDIAIDNQNPHGGRIFSASTADKRKKYSPPPPPLANTLSLQLLPLSSYVMRILSVHCYEDDIFRRLKCIQST